ncbi:MAG TPA: type IIL restriction-modification enzyme MmeI [Candidatus Andersenbacteria bacterium]|nr:type IIL restriction-modification enzyme MmeI [Candidatus Andersenbacteria bacterium]
MASLFGKNKLREIASKIDAESLEDKIAIVRTWQRDFHSGSLKQDKETSREQAYNQDFFIKILGYKEKPAIPFSFEPKATTEIGQLPDAVISYTDTTKGISNISAVVELKGASIPLERPQRREGNMSPIQQAFKYKTQYRNCPFVIVSNFWEFRLYRDNQLDYETWTLDDLVDPENDYLKFKTFYTLLSFENFTSVKGISKTEELLSDIRLEQEEIGKKFYKVYGRARLELLRSIYQKNEFIRNNIDIGVEKAQKIVDRIVFACFAEDRGLLPDNTLQRVIRDANNSTFGGSLWSTLKGFFEAIDIGSEKLEIPDGYNGGLFKRDEVLDNLKISDEALHSVIELSSYNFAEDLSVTILGHIFEQSISDLDEIKNKVKESQSLEVLQQSRRKKDGIFYTPDYIVRYIVENSLGTYLHEHEESIKQEFGLKGDINDSNYEKREKQAYIKYQEFLHNIKVVDPACGSGAFLVYVFDYLMAENKRVASILGNLLSSDIYVKSILRNNIYGVDLIKRY